MGAEHREVDNMHTIPGRSRLASLAESPPVVRPIIEVMRHAVADTSGKYPKNLANLSCLIMDKPI